MTISRSSRGECVVGGGAIDPEDVDQTWRMERQVEVVGSSRPLVETTGR